MTTIVVCNDKVYSDTQASMDSLVIANDYDKAQLIGDQIVAGCGAMRGLSLFIQKLTGCSDSEGSDELLNDFTGITVNRNYPGKVFIWENGCDPYAISQPATFGSGDMIAMGALEASGDPVKAVEAAIERDVFSGGEVRCVEFED